MVQVDGTDVFAAQRDWAHAQVELDTYLTQVLPALLAASQGASPNGFPTLTDEQMREIGGLYGRVVGLWALYGELRREMGWDSRAAAPVE